MIDHKKIQCQVMKLDERANLPEYATDGSGCFDIYACEALDTKVSVTRIISTGLAFEIPEGHVMLIYSRSGHGFNGNMRLANCVGVIDSDYRGELKIKLTKEHFEQVPFFVSTGTAIAQGMIIPIQQVQFFEVKELGETARGTGGFGSTDQKSLLVEDPIMKAHGFNYPK